MKESKIKLLYSIFITLKSMLDSVMTEEPTNLLNCICCIDSMVLYIILSSINYYVIQMTVKAGLNSFSISARAF